MEMLGPEAVLGLPCSRNAGRRRNAHCRMACVVCVCVCVCVCAPRLFEQIGGLVEQGGRDQKVAEQHHRLDQVLGHHSAVRSAVKQCREAESSAWALHAHNIRDVREGAHGHEVPV